MGRPATNHEARKKEIVDAALDCFSRYGYEGTSNRLIASTAGLKSAALIYHYFPNKESLFKACLESISLFDQIQNVIENGQDEPPEIFLKRVSLYYMKALQEERLSKMIPIIFSAFQSHPELPPIVLQKVSKAILEPMMRYFEHQKQAGTMTFRSAPAALQQFVGPMLLRVWAKLLLTVELPLGDAVSDEAFAESMISTFLNGVRVRDQA
ncbi:MAG TPA: TetR/AcrR family transcriptional regulator [Anaerolineaceae bacterium]|nr:TetR/AcrR family transcriptional regulator [Anaerolineaceae bacterium]HPN50254.1 TetR/AcrR family transcriptional regulator [Anaerolineaceae bacterium]